MLYHLSSNYMITIIHGEDIASSRDFYYQLKTKTADPIILAGETIQLTDFMQAVDSGGLFDDSKTIFIEDLLSKKKSKEEIDALLEYLKSKEKEADLVLWEGKPISKSIISQFKKAVIKDFSFPKHVFLFVEAFRPENGKQLIAQFHNLLKTNEPEFALFMLIRQVRLLLGLNSSDANQIDEVARLQPWQKTRLQNQLRYFSKGKLISIYKQLYGIDINSKTGKLNSSLLQAITLFLLGM